MSVPSDAHRPAVPDNTTNLHLAGTGEEGGDGEAGANGGAATESGPATKRSLESVKAGERLMDALELAELELKLVRADERAAAKAKRKGEPVPPARRPNPVLLNLSPLRYVLRTLQVWKGRRKGGMEGGGKWRGGGGGRVERERDEEEETETEPDTGTETETEGQRLGMAHRQDTKNDICCA